jgi:hypothetical protein
LPQSSTFFVAAVLVIGSNIAALAEPGQAAEPSHALRLLLPHEKDKALCFVSSGDPVTYELEDYPKAEKPRTATINRFVFELKSDRFPANDDTTPPTPGDPYYSYRMVADVAGKKVPLISAGECGAVDGAKVFGCGTDCDGGTMAFEPNATGDTLSMGVSGSTRRFRMSWGCGGGAAEGGRVEVLRHHPATPKVRMVQAEPKICASVARYFKRHD